MSSDRAAAGEASARARRWLLPLFVLLAWLVAAGPLGALGGKLYDEQRNDSSLFLPDSAESTQVTEYQRRFGESDALPVIVVWESPGGITPEVRQAVQAKAATLADAVGTDTAGAISPVIPSADGRALQVVIPLASSVTDEIGEAVDRLREVVQVPGARAYVTGPGGILADFVSAFDGVDGLLLLAAFGVVLLILLVVYRSPVLPFLVILTAAMALVMGQAAAYLMVKAGWITVDGQSQGIASVLVVGAATDYGLLLVARYREELYRHASRFTAMRRALRRCVEPVVASGATVIIGVLCLLLSDLGSNRALGPISAVNIVFSMLAALTFLPAVLALLGRAAFWPFRPRHGETQKAEGGRLWNGVAALVGRRPRTVLACTLLPLIAVSLLVPTLRDDGISQADAIRGDSQAVAGQQVLTRHYGADTASPALIVAPQADAERVTAAAGRVAGVTEVTAVGSPPTVVDGRVLLRAALAHPPDSEEAVETVRALRTAVRQVSPGALVGGRAASELDSRETAARDRNLIIPVVLAVIALVLGVLLRSLIAPLLLITTVMLNFTATLGVSAFVFNEVLDFPGGDPGTVLLGFVFLIALGVDYNIFLMTRAREESGRVGTREGVLRALAVTGGVITSAGLVLAATFGALSVLPLLILAQIAFIVAFGVLLDTIVVRSLLVPALVRMLGERTWWPVPPRAPRPVFEPQVLRVP